MQQGTSEPLLYGDVVDKFNRIFGKPYFSVRFKRMIKRCKNWKERAVCFTLTVFLMSCDRQCSVALPYGAVFWSAVCACGIPDHTHLFFFYITWIVFFIYI